MSAYVDEAASLRATIEGLERKVAQAESERDAAQGALREIRIGKVQADNDHPLGEYAAMTFRFMEIARRALARNPETPKKSEPCAYCEEDDCPTPRNPEGPK